MTLRTTGAAAVTAAGLMASVLVGQTPQASADTVLTLEGGVVGLQPWLQFTPLQLLGDLCKAPNHCQPVNYFAMPLGQSFNDQGAVKLNAAINALPNDGTPITLYGHSQGGQVIYSALRGWAAHPETAPDPARVSWVSIGNPENTFGGKSPDPIPANSPYHGTEVIRQYDGWADWPTTFNPLALANAIVGMQLVHPNYFKVDINDSNNITYVDGNITYVFVPNPVLPLVQLTGPLVPLLNPVLDPILRPIVESAYNRPVGSVTIPNSAAAHISNPAARVSTRIAAPGVTAARMPAKPAAATRSAKSPDAPRRLAAQRR